MEKTSKFVVENNSNPRGSNFYNKISPLNYILESFTLEDLKQWIIDINSWLTKNLNTKGQSGASSSELQNLGSKLKFIPETLEELLKMHNGQMQLLESFRTFSVKEIIEACEEYKIYGHWNNDYIPVAIDNDGSLLIIQTDKGFFNNKNINKFILVKF